MFTSYFMWNYLNIKIFFKTIPDKTAHYLL